MPFKFMKGAFESGYAGSVLANYAEHPENYLDERGKAKLGDVTRKLWQLLEEILEEDIERRLRLRPDWASDNFGDGPALLVDPQAELIPASDDPF